MNSELESVASEEPVAAEPAAVAEVPLEVLEPLADEIAGKTNASKRDLFAEVGLSLLRAVFAGSFAVWNERNRGDTSLERLPALIEKKGAKWSSSQLYRAVRLAEQKDHFGGFDRWPRLDYSHYRAVQGLPWDQQVQLLSQARDQGWSGEFLQREVSAKRGSTAQAPRPALEANRHLKRIARSVEDRDDLAADLTEAGISAEEIGEFIEALKIVDERRAALQQKLSPARTRRTAAVGEG